MVLIPSSYAKVVRAMCVCLIQQCVEDHALDSWLSAIILPERAQSS